VTFAKRAQAEAAVAIVKPLTQAVLRAEVIGKERRHRLSRHVPESGARHPAFGVLYDAEDAVETDQAIQTLLVNPLKELAVVRVERDLSFHARTRHLREMRDGVFSDGPGSPQWIGALPRLRGFSHDERLLSIAKSRVPSWLDAVGSGTQEGWPLQHRCAVDLSLQGKRRLLMILRPRLREEDASTHSIRYHRQWCFSPPFGLSWPEERKAQSRCMCDQ